MILHNFWFTSFAVVHRFGNDHKMVYCHRRARSLVLLALEPQVELAEWASAEQLDALFYIAPGSSSWGN